MDPDGAGASAVVSAAGVRTFGLRRRPLVACGEIVSSTRGTGFISKHSIVSKEYMDLRMMLGVYSLWIAFEAPFTVKASRRRAKKVSCTHFTLPRDAWRHAGSTKTESHCQTFRAGNR